MNASNDLTLSVLGASAREKREFTENGLELNSVKCNFHRGRL
jgi:hypothetical protein